MITLHSTNGYVSPIGLLNLQIVFLSLLQNLVVFNPNYAFLHAEVVILYAVFLTAA